MTAQTCFTDEITVDGFCGGGGWSTGFELAIGRPVDIGINHDAAAIALHKKNHPYTRHYNENIWEVDPRTACAGRPVGWAHFSPDCKHFSRAKGAKPVSKNIRGLAWVVLKWAGTVHPRIISMENVVEFVPKGTSKATGIKWLCNHLDIPLDETYAIGDSVNDLEMLESVGHGIAMGNSMPPVKEIAEYVTSDISDDGVKNALKHYGLI